MNAKVPSLRRYPPLLTQYYNYARRLFFSDDPAKPATKISEEFSRVDKLVHGCDYDHWLVVMDPPQDYPSRDQIIQRYVTTLSMLLGSEDAAKKSMYSVSTKYYYAFGCRIPETSAHRIKSLPNVRWVLPDSYLNPGENEYGGEPFIDGQAVPYDEKYHADWLQTENSEKCTEKTRSSRARRKKGKKP